ncbi:MAG: DNA repair protein RadC [Gammaproteobacteria bacterium]|nr:DNA repair protein RadC [Gammaproteobacteria bacterium]
MQNVLPINSSNNEDQFAKINACSLNMAEQTTLVRLAIEILELRHQPGVSFDSPQATREYLRLHLSDRKNEVFGVIFLDNKHRLLSIEELFTGSVSSASVYPRVVAQRTLECNASAVIFYHNHPSGNPEPSQSDIQITKRLNSALELIDVRTLDHLVIGNEGTVSFADRGLI